MPSLFSKKPVTEEHLNLPDVEKGQHSEIAHLNPSGDLGFEIVVPPAKRPLLSAENTALIAIILLILTAGFGMWSYARLGSLETLRRSDAQRHQVLLDSLQQVRAGLESNLGQLETAFADLSAGRDTLAMQLAAATNIITEKETVIREIQSQNRREENALRAQIQRLQTVKGRYETIIAVLERKNAALTAENARVRGTGDSLSLQVSELGRQVADQIRQVQTARFKATGFRVELTRRNDKLTLRARRTREVNFSFQLNDVPEFHQGSQQLYLVITDDQGVPIASDNPAYATIHTDKGEVAVVAQATQIQNIIDNQRIALSYKLEDRLKSGTYVVSVYSEKALLGVASFRLR
jgi:hypothetical protein